MKVWYHDPEVKEMCGKLVASMVERVKEVWRPGRLPPS
jgi:hypothetical protein